MGKKVLSWVVLAATFLLSIYQVEAQCVVINEIMINGASSNDGSNAPNTEEWVELYNTCNEPADISCFVLTDGDFSVTFPSGTTLAPGDHFVIGSSNSLVTIDFSWADCGCTAGSSVGIFTNGNEQLALLNENGGVEDAIYWGNGQFPVNIASSSIGSCSSLSINIPTADGNFELLPGGGGQGCTLARECDGSSTWVERCGDTVTANASNGQSGLPEFLTSNTEVCQGSCISFTDDTPFAVTSWLWTFEGAVTTSSQDQNPESICYDNPGVYDVTLTVTSSCGSSSQTVNNYITVSAGFVPTISPLGLISLCPGETQSLSSGVGNASAQWQFNGVDIPGATADNYLATEAGEYTITINNGSCSAISEPTVIAFYDIETPIIEPQPEINICDGATATLTAPAGYEFYQWTLDGNEIPGAISSSLEVSEAGVYALTANQFGCVVASNEVTVNTGGIEEFSLNVENETLCLGDGINLQAPMGFQSFQWYQNGVPIDNAIAGAYFVTEVGTYTVEAFDFGGCSGFSTEAIINFDTPPSVEILTDGGNFSFCEGAVIALYLDQSFDEIQWYFNGQPVGGGDDFLIIDSSGEVTVEVTEGACQTVSEPIETEEIFVDANISPTGTITTCNAAVTLNASPSGTIQWLADGVIIPGANGTEYIVSAPGDYSFTFTSPEGCIATSEITEVVFAEELEISIDATTTSICAGDEAILTVTGAAGDITWSTGEDSQEIVVTAEGIYSVEVINDQGCAGTASIEVSVIALPQVDAGNDTISDCSTGVMLSGAGTGTLTWSPAETLSDPNDPFALANPSSTTTYTLTATIGGCSATDEVIVEVDCASIFIPNVITPNSDGKNDFFQVIHRGLKTFELNIFNRWGNLIYSSTNPDDVWDGGVDGFYVSDGTYVWTVIALDFNNKPILDEDHSSGTLTVLR